MSWWQDYFGGDDFLLLEGAPDPERVARVATFICETLGLVTDSRVLDVGCGMGNHALALAGRGCLVTAIDANDYMVDHCRRVTADEPRVTAEKRDFHQMTYDTVFDAAICLGNTLGYGSREDDVRAVERMAASLVPGGRLLIELHNHAWYTEHMTGRIWWEEETAFVLSDVLIESDGRKLVTRDIIIPKDGSTRREYAMSLLQYRPDEIINLLTSAGIGQIAFYGDDSDSDDLPHLSADGFSDASRVMIATGRKL